MMIKEYSFPHWFVQNWSRTSLPMAIILFLLAPFLSDGLTVGTFLVFLHLPIYMLHQYEEHARGRFQAYVNDMMAGGEPVLSDMAIFWINIAGVWVLILAVLFLSHYISIVYGLIAVYLTLFNGVVHILGSIKKREYNPGLWTSIFLFLPFGGYSLYRITELSGTGFVAHWTALVTVILIHLIIFIHVRKKLVKWQEAG
jgi:hypothetical protein